MPLMLPQPGFFGSKQVSTPLAVTQLVLGSSGLGWEQSSPVQVSSAVPLDSPEP
ncbi:hypothetical protein D3C80_2210060 [compost metagenome]